MFVRPQISLLFFLFSFAIAQKFTSPSQWRKPHMTISGQARIQRASDTFKTTMEIFDISSGQFTNTYWGAAAPFYMSMAEFDLATNGTRYRDDLLSYFPKAEAARHGFLDLFVSLFLVK
ncbi:hypothetical protein PM082_022348 [Marasmius tenuissimus]|nr:hypothetical protein PM082_022348 [Marasmius tenuissimus]